MVTCSVVIILIEGSDVVVIFLVSIRLNVLWSKGKQTFFKVPSLLNEEVK